MKAMRHASVALIATGVLTLLGCNAQLPVDGAAAFPTNEHGQTYGSIEDADFPDSITMPSDLLDGLPDLVKAQGNDGTVGYVYKEDLLSDTSIPLYAKDGETVIGTYGQEGE